MCENGMQQEEPDKWFGFDKNYSQMIREVLGRDFYMNENMDKPTVYEIACREMTRRFREQKTLIVSLYSAVALLIVFVVIILVMCVSSLM